MNVRHISLDQCTLATGTVVVIDVLRAFTTAAIAFSRGATEILMASTVEEALVLKKRFPDALLMGEVEGLPIPGFDFGNSPFEISKQDLAGRRLIQRTTAGVQGVMLSTSAERILATSFPSSGATLNQVRGVKDLVFVATGTVGWGDGQEDVACAKYLEARLKEEKVDPAPFLDAARRAPAAEKFMNSDDPRFLVQDLEIALQVDTVDFAMEAIRRDDLLVLAKVA